MPNNKIVTNSSQRRHNFVVTSS